MTLFDSTTQTIFYDIFNYEVIQIEIISAIDAQYFCALNRTTNTPIKVWHGRVNELFLTELDAQKALRELLYAKLKMNSEEIIKLTPIESTV